ncbi:MAG: iron-sulfur cluster assembly scaffold protein [Desulfobacteraceae bacterium]|nr:iron-sulfur cluster assembly scaffold protein [Desulfobacteraceae bacterium]
MENIDTDSNEPFTEAAVQQQLLDHPDGYGVNTGRCGDTVELFLKSHGHKIEQAHYRSDGCMATHLCALTVIELTHGRLIEHAWRLTADHIIAALPDLPEDHHHCAELAVGALYRALNDLRENRQKPWARLYRGHRPR